MPLHSINPATGETLRSFSALTQETLSKRIAVAAEAAKAHAALPMEHRTRCLRKLAQLFTGEQTELASTVARETGNPVRYAVAEIQRCAEACCYYAEEGPRLLSPDMLHSRGEGIGRKHQSYIVREPLGVLLAVVQTGSPFWQACRVLLPALTAGNVVMLKHAAHVSQCALLLETLVRRAGFLRGACSALLMEDALVETALHDERVSAVTVVGTESAGRALSAQAGWLLKKSLLHVLGNGATVVMPSADMDSALAAAVEALTCGVESGKRLIVHTGIYHIFTQRLVKAVETLSVGNPLKPRTDVGPLSTRDALDALNEHIQAAVKAGGRVLTGGTRLVGGGYFFEPTLLGDVPRDSSIAREVLTGPAAVLFRVRDLEDAIKLANTARYPGESSVWTREPAEQQQLLASINSRAVTLNASPRPYGQLGMSTLRDFTEAKTITLA